MQLNNIDWLIIASFFVISLFIGIIVSRKSGKNITEFFLSGRKMPWWLLGISMVATTFSADTPNLVTDIVRTNGVAGNPTLPSGPDSSKPPSQRDSFYNPNNTTNTWDVVSPNPTTNPPSWIDHEKIV
jgi:hypothetical protein